LWGHEHGICVEHWLGWGKTKHRAYASSSIFFPLLSVITTQLLSWFLHVRNSKSAASNKQTNKQPNFLILLDYFFFFFFHFLIGICTCVLPQNCSCCNRLSLPSLCVFVGPRHCGKDELVNFLQTPPLVLHIIFFWFLSLVLLEANTHGWSQKVS
jgi:hypothetical protein